jgi:hypothetical protein
MTKILLQDDSNEGGLHNIATVIDMLITCKLCKNYISTFTNKFVVETVIDKVIYYIELMMP